MTIFVDNVINEDLALACDEYTLSIQDGRRIWTENYPYAFGGFSNLQNSRTELLHGLPNVETRIRLRKYVASKFGYDAAKSDVAC